MAKKKLNFSQVPQFAHLEEEVLQYWQESKAFERSVSNRSADKSYVFYDGPPFATGMPHYGHLLASTIKDVVPRYWTMKGYRVERVWGWDCHGLPIENMIEGQLKIKGGKKGIEALGIDKFNAACRAEVLRLDKEWEKIIGRLARWVDFDHSYKTMDTNFMESVWWGFKQLYDKEMVYEGRKVILYCPRCSTPLSNFEIAMDNSYKEVTEPGTTYKYPVAGEANTYLLAWSTTPWNKLVTPALAVNPNLEYVKVKQGDAFYWLANTRLSELDLAQGEYQVVEKKSGAELSAVTFTPHFDFFPNRKAGEKVGVVVADDFVTAEEGTGIVTLAVYGEDDYRVMKQHQIQLAEHVDDEGKLKPEVTTWAGMPILDANPLIDADLAKRGFVYRHAPHTHTVPTCYRCGTRLYYAPLPAWFINIAQMRQHLLAQNENINWFPQHLKHGRFAKGLENAPDWNISRSRYWGTPMPIWQATDAAGNTQIRVIGSIAELQQWAVDSKQAAAVTDIHREYLDNLQVWVDDAKTLKGTRIPEVFDCWVESGSMPFAAIHYPFEHKQEFEQTYPAQFVSEYIAQTRAWFYTMHVMSVAIFGHHAFENVLTTGTILAEDGAKMSKSKKNYPDPMLVVDNYGADSLRLYLMSSPIMKGENLNFAEKEVADIRRRVFVIWWNMLSFYHQLDHDQLAPQTAPPTVTHVLDRWLMARLGSVVAEVTEYFDHYDVVKASRTIMAFVDELSTWYLRLSRERLRQADATDSRAAFGHALYTLAQLAAPLAPYFAEVVHQALVDADTSIHHTDWPVSATYSLFADNTLEKEMGVMKAVVEAGHSQRKASQLKVRQPLAGMTVTAPAALQLVEELNELAKQELNLKQIVWVVSEGATELTVVLDTAMTPALIAEGKARELMRDIQRLRKEAGKTPTDHVRVQLPEWPAEFQKEIELKTKAELVQGATFELLP